MKSNSNRRPKKKKIKIKWIDSFITFMPEIHATLMRISPISKWIVLTKNMSYVIRIPEQVIRQSRNMYVKLQFWVFLATIEETTRLNSLSTVTSITMHSCNEFFYKHQISCIMSSIVWYWCRWLITDCLYWLGHIAPFWILIPLQLVNFGSIGKI